MKYKKITIFTSSLEGGGAERVIATLANNFVKNGHKVDLLLVRSVGPFLSEIDEKVNIISLGATKNIFSLLPLISFLRKNKPEVILSTLAMPNFIVILAKYLTRVNTRIVLREAITASVDDNFKKKKFISLFPYLRKWTLNKANYIIAPSIGVCNDLVNSYGINQDKIKVIYNPINIERCFHMALEKNNLLDSIPPNKNVILGIGRLTEQKDFFTLINAFKIVRSKFDSVLIILGEGNCRKQLETLVDKNKLKTDVFLPGFISNPFPFLKRASLFVLSSLYEGMPNVLIQAVLFQKQIVATNCPSGPFEILQGGDFGYLAKISDEKDLVIGMEKGLEGLLKLVPIQQAIELYNSNDVAEKYLDILNK